MQENDIHVTIDDIKIDAVSEKTEKSHATSEEPSGSNAKFTKSQKQKRDFVEGIQSYLKSHEFSQDLKKTSQKTGIPERVLATNFFEKILGTIGDVFGISIGIVRNVGHTVIDLFTMILNGGIDIICNVADALSKIITLNKTVH